MEQIRWLISWLNFLFPIVFAVFLVYYLVVIKKRYDESIAKMNQCALESVQLLREIRDLLKK